MTLRPNELHALRSFFHTEAAWHKKQEEDKYKSSLLPGPFASPPDSLDHEYTIAVASNRIFRLTNDRIISIDKYNCIAGQYLIGSVRRIGTYFQRNLLRWR